MTRGGPVTRRSGMFSRRMRTNVRCGYSRSIQWRRRVVTKHRSAERRAAASSSASWRRAGVTRFPWRNKIVLDPPASVRTADPVDEDAVFDLLVEMHRHNNSGWGWPYRREIVLGRIEVATRRWNQKTERFEPPRTD